MERVDRRVLSFIALAASMLYGIGFVVIDDPSTAYIMIGAVVVALLWIAVGRFGRRPIER